MLDKIRNSIGREPLCNHRPERGLYIHGFCLPLCARCTGILLGAIAALLACQLLELDINAMSQLILGLAMIVPTGIDGLVEYAFGIESNNPRRLITGLLAGVGCVITEMTIRNII